MRTVPVYQVLAEDLKALGVDTVFGLMSDCICQLFSTLDAMGVRMIGARHETNALRCVGSVEVGWVDVSPVWCGGGRAGGVRVLAAGGGARGERGRGR